MYTLNEQQIDFILHDIKTRGVDIESLQLNLLDHICCIVESELQEDGNFDQFYQQLIPKFFRKDLKEIEDETILLLTFKNYYAMKKAMIITGITSVTLFIIGSLFKIMLWPGAGPLLVFGIGSLSLVFLPLMFVLKAKDSSSKNERLLSGVGALIGFLICLAALFSVMHWPHALTLWIVAICIATFVFIPIYFYNGMRNPDTRLNTLVTTILILGATGLLFIMVNIRPAKKQLEIKMYTHIQSEDLLRKMQQHAKQYDPLASDIDTTAERIKSLIIEGMIGKPFIPKDFEAQKLLGEEENLGPAFFKEGAEGAILFSHLKETVAKYNSTLTLNEGNKIPIDHFQEDKIGFYNNYVVLNYVVQLQMYLATDENKMTASK
ncbi:MAG: hypothetical protein ABI315_01725 [Bacteroidia bacterium]